MIHFRNPNTKRMKKTQGKMTLKWDFEGGLEGNF